MIIRRVFPVLFLLFTGTLVASEHNSVYINSFTFYDSEPVPFQRFEKSWGKGFRGGNSAISYVNHELGFSLGSWGFGYVSRSASYVQFGTETAALVNILAQKRPIYGDGFLVDVRVKSFNATGARLFYQLFERRKIRMQIGASLLQADRLVDGSLKGRLAVISQSDYRFENIVLDYFYSVDKLFDHQVAQPKGRGFALDTRIFWSPTPRLAFKLNIGDILGRINWQDAPYTLATIESDNKAYDENGYVKVDPLLKGKQLTKSFTQYLPVYFLISSEMRLRESYSLLFELESVGVKSYPRGGLRKQISRQYAADLIFDPLNRVLGLRFSHAVFHISVASDSLDINNAYMVSASAGIRWGF